MARSLNKVTLIGTLGRDPEVRFMPNGNAVANINLATDESYNDKQTGQKVEQTEWHRLTIYGRLAEIAQQYLKKGSRAYFEGKLKTREWEKDGVKRYTTEIVVSEMLMLDGRPNDGFQGSAQTQAPAQYAQPYQSAPQPAAQYAQAPANAAPAGQGYGQAPSQNPNYGYAQPMSAPQQPQRPAQPQPMPQNHFDNSFDDDIPF